MKNLDQFNLDIINVAQKNATVYRCNNPKNEKKQLFFGFGWRITMVKTIVMLLVFAFLNINIGLAHQGVHRFENLWLSEGPIGVLTQANQKLGLSDLEMNAFVFKYKDSFTQLKSDFWESTKDTSDFNFAKQQKNLSNNKASLESWITEFNKAKLEKKENYTTAMENFQKALLTPPTPAAPQTTICDNVGFEKGNTTNWQLFLGSANSSYFTSTGLGYRMALVNGTSPVDSIVGSRLPVVKPGGAYSLRLENYKNGGDAAKAEFTFIVDASKPVYQYSYAWVLEDPGSGHPSFLRPYFMVQFIDNSTGNEINCLKLMVVAEPSDKIFGNPKYLTAAPGSAIKFAPWTDASADLSSFIGKSITVRFTVSDCALAGHLGYAYIDGNCLKDNVMVGPCLPDGTRTLTVDGLFENYTWKGNGIVGSNKGKSIVINDYGNYILTRINEKYCFENREKLIIQPPCPPVPPIPCNLNLTAGATTACDAGSNLYSQTLSFTLSNAPLTGIVKIQTGKIEQILELPITSPYSLTIPNLPADGTLQSFTVSVYKSNYVSLNNAICTQTIQIQALNACFLPSPMACENCISGFAPTVGETYIVSAWVKEDGANGSTTNYNNPFIQLHFGSGTTSTVQFVASGKIIEGWQRIYAEFNVPSNATNIQVELGTLGGMVYFDDIRVYPIKASMKSYVYDPISLKLVAVLDENNYATLYEYDQEGALIRTKKETEKGVVTISENRQSNPKR